MPIERLYGVGDYMAKRLAKLGIEKVGDLLRHYPARYDDFSKVVPIAKTLKNQSNTIKGRIIQIKNERSPRKRMPLTHALISDETGSLAATWFNQPYLIRILKKGQEFIFVGKIEYGYGGWVMKNPAYERATTQDLVHTARIVPVYPETRGISSKWLRAQIKPILDRIPTIPDFMPEKILREFNLMDLDSAQKQIHFPHSLPEAERARRRIAFNELFLLQLKMMLAKKKWQAQVAPEIKFNKQLVRKLVAKLPYKLTNAQRKAAWEILMDLEKPHPMNRLLEGDVGSGKTIVAAIAMLICASRGYQSIIMAPTEILAIQHYKNLVELLEGFNMSVGLLTSGKNELEIKNLRPRPASLSLQRGERGERGSPKAAKIKKTDLVKKIQKGDVDIVIGTHALITEKMKFNKLGLAIIDEQHRFGVKQRATLRKKAQIQGKSPHILSMTATPIPRTLSLAMYGDLDLSILDQLPPGRQKIITRIVSPEKRQRAYRFIQNMILEKGQQVFVICPLIDESDKLGVRAATAEYKKLHKEIFPDLRIALLHGKMKTKDKEKVMAEFKVKKFDILVSTAVVEVGVDIPNATCMMIEGAERFGLAQLHQFRGRVGRGSEKSFCLLFTDAHGQKIFARLNALVQSSDGFELAEKDLQFRGPGELDGIAQSGIADLKMASLLDAVLIKQARKAAEEIISDGIKHYPLLLKKIKLYNQGRRIE